MDRRRYGFAERYITPDRPVDLPDYAARTEPSEGLHLPLLATAMVLDDGEHRMAWVGADLLGFYEELSGPVREPTVVAAAASCSMNVRRSMGMRGSSR